MRKPFWLIYPPKEYYAFRRQGLSNLIDAYSHMGAVDGNCHYCNRDGDDLWWTLPTCRAHNWHIKNFFKPGGPRTFGVHPKHTDNPFRKKD